MRQTRSSQRITRSQANQTNPGHHMNNDEPNSPVTTDRRIRTRSTSNKLTSVTDTLAENDLGKLNRNKIGASKNCRRKPSTLTCRKCNITFTRKWNLERHEETHKRNRQQFSCEKCMLLFYSDVNLNKHRLCHLTRRKKPYKCPKCDKPFARKRAVTEHVKIVHPKRTCITYSCTNCKKSFKNKQYLTQHTLTHKENAVPCDQCGAKFRSKQHLERHQLIHQENNFKCTECDKPFSQKRNLDEHYVRIHHVKRNVPVFRCKKCDKNNNQKNVIIFTRKYDYKRHLLIHSDKKPYSCSECPKAFRQKSHLAEHITMVHVRIKTHPCTDCKKSFTSEGLLKKHLVTHENFCDICDENFLSKMDLRRHMEDHINE